MLLVKGFVPLDGPDLLPALLLPRSSTHSSHTSHLRYCPEGTLSPHQFPCGNSSVYCPEGSPAPLLATRGYFTTSDEPSSATALRTLNRNQLRTSQSLCPSGHYCQHGCSPDSSLSSLTLRRGHSPLPCWHLWILIWSLLSLMLWHLPSRLLLP
jgi:hypothetical protein